MDDQKKFVLVLDRNYDGEGYSLGVFDKDTYVMTDGDCLEREGDTLDGYTAEFLTDYQLEQKLDALRKDSARYRWLIKSEDNADELHVALMNHGGDEKGVDAQIDDEMEGKEV